MLYHPPPPLPTSTPHTHDGSVHFIRFLSGQVHISQDSSVPDHCKKYALSCPGDKDYISQCDHDHKEQCDRCNIFPNVVTEVIIAIL